MVPPPLIRAFTMMGRPGRERDAGGPGRRSGAAGVSAAAGADGAGWPGVLIMTAPPRACGGTLLIPWENRTSPRSSVQR